MTVSLYNIARNIPEVEISCGQADKKWQTPTNDEKHEKGTEEYTGRNNKKPEC